MGPINSVEDLILMLKRRLAIVVTVLALGLLVALYLAVTSPRVYEAVAVIQVDAPALVDTGSDAGVPAARRVQLIEQSLMSRSNMLEMIERHKLYETLPLTVNEKVALLRSSARIESVAASGRDGGGGASAPLSAIIISVGAETAHGAAGLANDFADSIINMDEVSRQARIEETRDFLTAEEARELTELDNHDRLIANYVAENEDSLPTSQEFIRSEMNQLREQEATLDRDIMGLDREKLALQIEEPVAEGRPAGSLAQQLRSAELELAQARRTFAEGHPEIARLEASTLRLAQGGVSETARIVDEQVALIDSQLVQLRQQKADISQRQTEIEHARNRVPDVTREYGALIRDQQRLRDRYAEISRRLAEVEMMQMLLENNQTERFVVLERAVPPEYPVLSGRKKSAIMGGFAAIMVAIGIAFVTELLNPVLRTARQFEKATGTRPVIDLRYMPDDEDADTAWRRRIYISVVLFWTLVAAVWLIGYLPGIPSPGVVGPMGSG